MALPDNTRLEGALPAPAPRLWAVDAARGAAVLGMVAYHTAWDLSELSLVALDVAGSWPWRALARTVAASFLTLVGIGLALAHGRELRLGAFGRRIAAVAGAALLVTVATRIVFPGSYVFFGVLHNIALSSLLALPFVRWSTVVAAGAAVAVWALGFAQTHAFDGLLLAFTGLGLQVPDTNDYVPLVPWTGFVLAGVAAGRLGWVGPRRPPPAIGRALAAIGRRSLAIYLLHQPLIFGTLFAVRSVIGPNPAAEAAPFLRNCVASCAAAGTAMPRCDRACACTLAGMRRGGLWERLSRPRPEPDDIERASDLAQACLTDSG